MVKLLKTMIPTYIVEILKRIRKVNSFIWAVFRDAKRFYRFSGVFIKNEAESSLASLITIDYHRLEKGLALPNPRIGFGVTAAGDLQSNLVKFMGRYGVKSVCLEAISALSEYYLFNEEFTKNDNALYAEYLKIFQSINVDDYADFYAIAGTVETSREEVVNASNINYKQFFKHRHSVRTFSNEAVDTALIDEAISIAQEAPSVCNRQPWKVYCVQSGERVTEILKIQSGARGFEDGPDKLLVISVDVRAFHYAGERNEYWVDGGIFTMSVLNALHAVGLGTCCMNWCVDKKRDELLRKTINLPASEVVIVLIAIGHYPEKFKVAVSPTKETSLVIKYI